MKKIGIVSNDAGGAELLSSYIQKYKKNEYFYYLKGPSKKIYLNKIKNLHIEKNFQVFFSKIKYLICSSSWKSNLELRAIKLAKQKKIKSVVFLDHWVNYKMRHKIKSKLILPDLFWVADKEALIQAKKEFKNKKIILKKNYYLDNFKKIKMKDKFKKNSILYICDPKRKSNVNYSENDSINFLLINLKKISKNIPIITIRPHPSELKNKYISITKKNKKLVISKRSELLDDIENHEIIVGTGSMAMLVASIFRKKIYCSMPPMGKSLIPNIKNLKYIKDLK